MNADLPNWVADCCARGAESVLVQTNGRRLAYAKFAKQLRKSGADALEVSMAGPRPEIHDYHTNVAGSYAQTVTGVRTAISAGARVGLTLIVTRSNYRHLAEQVELAARLHVDALNLSCVRPWGLARSGLQRLLPRFIACVPYIARAVRTGRQLGLPVFVTGFPHCFVTNTGAWPLLEHAREHDNVMSTDQNLCAGCARRAACPGFDSVYRDLYGTDELSAFAAHAANIAELPASSTSEHRDLFVGPGQCERISSETEGLIA